MVRAAYACLKNRAEAEDVAQEVFLIPSGKALRRTGRGPPEGMAAEGHGQQRKSTVFPFTCITMRAIPSGRSLPAATVGTRLSRGRALLKRELKAVSYES